MTSPTPATYTARQCAEYVLATYPNTSWRKVSFAKLQTILFDASMHSMLDRGVPLFAEPFYAMRSGPVVKSVSEDWLRHWRVSRKRQARRLPALRRRVKLWCLQEVRRRPNNIARLNMPGGWKPVDERAQYAGLVDYVKHRGLVAKMVAIAKQREASFGDNMVEASENE